nr:HD-GYP domain-containing protein [Metabacillus iocasae]
MFLNNLLSSAFAVFGVGSTFIFYTISLSLFETIILLVIMVLSVLIMITCEFVTYKKQIKPIKLAFTEKSNSLRTLQQAYEQAHTFPVLTVKRILIPHLLGLSIPASLLASFFIFMGHLTIPYYFIILAWAGAILIATMHALIEFFLTFRTIQPLLTYLSEQAKTQFSANLSLHKNTFISIKKKMLTSSLFSAIFPVMLFSLANEVHVFEQQGLRWSEYWSWASIILVMVMIIALSGAFLLYKNIQQPLHELQEAFHDVKNGEFNVLENTYSDEFSQLVTGYNHMVTAIKERDALNKQLLESFFTVFAATLDARDHYTAGHSIRVASYAVKIGENAHLNEQELNLLKKSALLHDIGKIGIPDRVLLKDGRLTDEEFSYIKQHPVIGATILEQVSLTEEMKPILPGVKYHHERFDGKGYPDGLKEKNIPLFGRIIAVADAFDAMTSDRPYRKGMSVDKALAILEDGKGTQWDPYFASLFIKIMKEKDSTDSNSEPAYYR